MFLRAKLSASNGRGCCSGSSYLLEEGDFYVLACRFTDSQCEEAVTALTLNVHLSGIYSSVVFRRCEHVTELVKDWMCAATRGRRQQRVLVDLIHSFTSTDDEPGYLCRPASCREREKRGARGGRQRG